MDVYYWVIQDVGGRCVAHGPYRTQEARDNRFDSVRGGTVYKFNSVSPDPTQAIQEFKAAVINQ